MRSIYDDVAVRVSLGPDTYADNGTFNGEAVDRMEGGARFTESMVVVVLGEVTASYDGELKLQSSADGSSWTDVSSGLLVGEIPTVTTGNAETVHVIGYKGEARFLRLVLTAAEAADQTAAVTGLVLMAPGGRVPMVQLPGEES